MTDHGLIIATLLVGVVGVGVGVGNFIYQRKQAIITEKDYRGRTTTLVADAHWNNRTEKVIRQLLRITPTMQITPPGGTTSLYLYDTIFPDVRFKRELTDTIIAVDSGITHFMRRELQAHELRSEYLRGVVAKAEAHIEEFRKSHPNLPNYLGD
jgi:hypothetical protein